MEPAVSQESIQGKQAITANNALSLLLRLPQEIKDHIYVLVCGGALLHFKFAPSLPNPKLKFSHIKCLSQTTEEATQASFDASNSPWFDEVSANRHESCCSPRLFCDVSGRISRRLTLDLRFLRTCRQIYEEARSFCYTANIFAFDDWNVFVKCVKTVSWVSYVRSIRLRIRSETNGNGPSTRDTLRDVSGKLKGLRWIHVDLEQLYVSGSRGYDRGAEEASHLTEQLLCFAGTALKTAAVVISDSRFCDFNSPEIMQCARDDARSQGLNRWTMAQKQEYSRFLRNALLRHKGKEIDIEGAAGSSRPLRIWWDGMIY